MDWTNIHDWLWLFLGIVLAGILHMPEHTRIKVPSRTMDWAFVLFTLIFVLWSASYSTNIAAITAEGKEMTQIDIQKLYQYADFLRIAALIVLGFLVGHIVFGVIQGIRIKKSSRSKEIGEIRDKVRDYRELKNELDQFFNDIENDKGRNPIPKSKTQPPLTKKRKV